MSPSHSELENKSRVTEAILNPSESNRALQAFQLLSECPEAQVNRALLLHKELYVIIIIFIF